MIPMTGAELRTIRDSLGLSADQFAQMVGVRDRTVRRWEVGDWPVPDEVAKVLSSLDAQIEHSVIQAVDTLKSAQDAVNGEPDDVVLIRYRTDADLARYRPDMATLPGCVHGALIDRVRLAFGRIGVKTRLVWMDSDSYQKWLGKRKDSDSFRAAWAAQQIK